MRSLVGQQGYFCNRIREQPAEILGMRVSISSALSSPQRFDQTPNKKLWAKFVGAAFGGEPAS